MDREERGHHQAARQRDLSLWKHLDGTWSLRGIRGSGAKAATADIFAVLDYADGGTPTDRPTLKFEGRVIEPTDLRLSFNIATSEYTAEAQFDDGFEVWLKDIPEDGPGMKLAELPKAAGNYRIGRLADAQRSCSTSGG